MARTTTDVLGGLHTGVSSHILQRYNLSASDRFFMQRRPIRTDVPLIGNRRDMERTDYLSGRRKLRPVVQGHPSSVDE
ncbi:hypothetical protein KKY53_10560 [Pseudomonas aeruginosa]|uniref:hypothetical protein n=1 Tax=Pseudomonas aeruginosa TaxID=287 RepID=UPI0012987C27|nr:hypothetical protein [Pseudomonas aeruginosa]WCV80967.1 hypothetical protein KKY53_10560 [Pseudomonas aeruginosa]HBO0862844.1 hypothetical protein [Pseudomonas aeruginosa]HCE6878308.1 hypothetical protein [Pseudomonas aeruginosa]HDR2971530.1 hypothetical protein [Pseudomonas aeruginosa]